jgi:hypothetical protein
MLMTHKTSIVICEMSDGTQDIYVNGAQVTVGEVQKIRIEAIANSRVTTAGVVASLKRAVAQLERVLKV